MKKTLLYMLLPFMAFVSCDRLYDTPMDDDRLNAGINDPEPKFYMEQFDPIADEGQYWMPDHSNNYAPVNHGWHWLYATGLGNKNDANVPNGNVWAGGGFGLQHSLLCQSFAGLNDRALAAGKVRAGVWMDAQEVIPSIKRFQKANKISASWISWAGNILTNPGFKPLDGGVCEAIGKNYVLTDVVNNPESGNVAVVASHVFNAFIVDVRDQEFFENNGYKLVYDATEKSTEDAWREFKDKCDNRALVVMPVHTSELADFAIANSLFVINVNKQNGTAAGGQNKELFKEVLAWLQPNSPVFGWEPGVGEDDFVIPVSKSGNMMVAIHDYNLPYISKGYKEKQRSILANVLNPQDIDFEKPGKFVSFYTSDGAHLGWMRQWFVENYYLNPKGTGINMSYGVSASNLCQIDPLQFEYLINNQPSTASLIESFGGGYWYADDFGSAANRPELLKSLAQKVASHMRQHRIKVIEQIAHDPKSEAAMETYQALVDANDQLEGIIAIQYAPSYAAGAGDIMWVTNKVGYDIPIITVRYSIWNFGDKNLDRDGTPTYIAHKLNAEPEENKFSSVIVHAWSNFYDTVDSEDELAENQKIEDASQIYGPGAAEMCARRLDEDINVVNTQELIWRVRMEYRPEQTKKYLQTYF